MSWGYMWQWGSWSLCQEHISPEHPLPFLYCDFVILELPSIIVFWSNGKMAGFIPESVWCIRWQWWCTCRGLLVMLWLLNCKWQYPSYTQLPSVQKPTPPCVHPVTYQHIYCIEFIICFWQELHYEKLVSNLLTSRWTWTDLACDTPINPLLPTLESSI